MKIHFVFHVSLLKLAVTDSLSNHIFSSLSSVEVDDDEEFEVDEILDFRYHYRKLQYLVK